MSRIRSRAAAAPLRRFSENASQPSTIDRLVAELRPIEPVYCIRSAVLKATARRFVGQFPGHVLYAVKCNPEPSVLRALWRGGVRHFDCASISEIRLVRQLFAEAGLYYMHPIKPEPAIREAWFRHGVRDFSLDSAEEIDKIVGATEGEAGLGLHIRLALPKGHAVFDLSGKFGAPADLAVALLRKARPVAGRLGICFHVGSQCLDPADYARAIALAAQVAAESGVRVDVIDVGGGFPAVYPGQPVPPALEAYFAAIENGAACAGLPEGVSLWCEPGRAMVAAGVSVVVRVDARRGDVLHINDGVYGTLSDAGVPRVRFPARLIRASEAAPRGFAFYGPTCDSADYMAGPFVLPDDVAVGDWIELGQLGAYGGCLRTSFNGFDRILMAEVDDPPLGGASASQIAA